MNCQTHVMGQSEDTSEWLGITTKATNGFRQRGQKWVKNQVAPRQILHQLFSGHCSLSTGGTAQISFYYVREFLLVDHSSSLNKVIHTDVFFLQKS